MKKGASSAAAESRTARAVASPRLNFAVTKALHKKIKIAAALADMEVGDWVKAVLTRGARMYVEKALGEEE